jgi:predicted nucleotidyltransferase
MTAKTLALSAEEGRIVTAILREFVPERAIWAFGSRVKGGHKPFSDLDLVVIGEEPLPLTTMANLTEAFSESDLPYKVDVVDWATTSESFRRVIEAGYVGVQGKNG